jgi:hypothetical protein
MRLSVLPASLAAGFLGLVLAAQPRAEVIFQGAGASPPPSDAGGRLPRRAGRAKPQQRRRLPKWAARDQLGWGARRPLRAQRLAGRLLQRELAARRRFSTPGTALQVSATAASGTPVEFGNLNPTYPDISRPSRRSGCSPRSAATSSM